MILQRIRILNAYFASPHFLDFFGLKNMKASSPYLSDADYFLVFSFFSGDAFLLRVLTVTFAPKAALKLILSSRDTIAVALGGSSSPLLMESLPFSFTVFLSLEKSLFSFLLALPLVLGDRIDFLLLPSLPPFHPPSLPAGLLRFLHLKVDLLLSFLFEGATDDVVEGAQLHTLLLLP